MVNYNKESRKDLLCPQDICPDQSFENLPVTEIAGSDSHCLAFVKNFHPCAMHSVHINCYSHYSHMVIIIIMNNSLVSVQDQGLAVKIQDPQCFQQGQSPPVRASMVEDRLLDRKELRMTACTHNPVAKVWEEKPLSAGLLLPHWPMVSGLVGLEERASQTKQTQTCF